MAKCDATVRQTPHVFSDSPGMCNVKGDRYSEGRSVAIVPYSQFSIFVFMLFSVSLVLFRIAEVDYWDKPCTAIFVSRFTATNSIALIYLTSNLPSLSCYVVVCAYCLVHALVFFVLV